MRLIKKAVIIDFYSKHPTSKTPLEDWYKTAKSATWADLNDIKKNFNSVDFVGNRRYVFNIKGNDFRLVAIILFKSKTIYIRFIGTHPQYDKIKDIKNI